MGLPRLFRFCLFRFCVYSDPIPQISARGRADCAGRGTVRARIAADRADRRAAGPGSVRLLRRSTENGIGESAAIGPIGLSFFAIPTAERPDRHRALRGIK